MNNISIMIVRIILAVVFAVVITRFFFGRFEPMWVVGLAIFLAGMSYVTEYFRNRKRDR